jgi:manganese/zinc/iron transport system substrate-binding protein
MLNRRDILAGLTATLATPTFATGPVQVVATTGMIADLVSRIGGEHVSVKALMGPGVDPHAYRLTRSDIVDMTRADLVFWHGLYLEAQIESFMETLTGRVPTKAVADSLDTTTLLAHEDYDGRYDPHVWMDPKLWAKCTTAVVETLTLARPEVQSIFEANAERFIADAMALEGYSRDILMQVPEEQRVLGTAHDAFGYFGRAYGFDVQGIQGISTESEAGLNRVKELVDMIVARNLRAVFVETSVSDRSVRALVEGAEAQGHKMEIGGALFSDAMGQPGTYEGTWLGMIDHNVTTISQAMGVNVPERGRLGQLGY